MRQHERFPHIFYQLTQGRGHIMIYAVCRLCGEELNWRCTGGPDRVKWRINTFANLHNHGVARPIQNPMPRGMGNPPPRSGGW